MCKLFFRWVSVVLAIMDIQIDTRFVHLSIYRLKQKSNHFVIDRFHVTLYTTYVLYVCFFVVSSLGYLFLGVCFISGYRKFVIRRNDYKRGGIKFVDKIFIPRLKSLRRAFL